MRSAENERVSFIKRLGFSFASAAGGAVASLLAAFASAFVLVLTSSDYESAATPCAIICAAIGALVSGFIAARQIGRGGLASGLLAGACFLAVAVIFGCVVTFSAPNLFGDWSGGATCAAILLSSAAGGIAGVNLGGSKR